MEPIITFSRLMQGALWLLVLVPPTMLVADEQAGERESEADAIATLRKVSPAAVYIDRMTGAVEVTLRNPSSDEAKALNAVANLRRLSLIVTDRGSAWLECLKQVRRTELLSLGSPNIEFSDDDFKDFPPLPPLQMLRLGRVKLSAEGWRHVCGSIRTSRLEILVAALDEDSMRSIAEVPGLQHLVIGSSPTTGAGLNAFAGKSLESLSLSDTSLTDGGLAELATIRSLKEIHVNRADASNEGLRHLLRLSNLEKISLSRIAVTNETVALFTGFPKLKSLSVTDTKTFTGDTLARLQGLALESVAFDRTKLGDEGFAALATIPTLKAISVSWSQVGPQGLAAFERLDRPLKINAGVTRIRTGAAREFSVRNPKAWIEVGAGQTLTAFQNGVALSGGPDNPTGEGRPSGK